MPEYTAEIKEVGHPSILTPSLCCEEKTKEELIDCTELSVSISTVQRIKKKFVDNVA